MIIHFSILIVNKMCAVLNDVRENQLEIVRRIFYNHDQYCLIQILARFGDICKWITS